MAQFEKGKIPAGSTPFQPGQTGNPNGRPKGPSFRTVFQKIMEGKITAEQAGQKIKMTKKEAMCAKLVEDAMQDPDPNVRRQAIVAIMNRVDGMPVSRNAFTDTEGNDATMNVTINTDNLSVEELRSMTEILTKATAQNEE
jgi:hypothetical protein